MNNTLKTEKKVNSYWSNFFKAPSDKTDLESVISLMPPFKNLSPKYLKELLKLIHHRNYDANEYIFYQGDPGIGLFIIEEGYVNIIQEDEECGPRVLAEFERGDFFGDMALLEESARSASAIAVEESKMAVIFKPDLDEFIDRHPVQGVNILRGLSQIIASRLRILNKEYSNLYNVAYPTIAEQEDGLNQKNIDPS